jgi:hypothetical protein
MKTGKWVVRLVASAAVAIVGFGLSGKAIAQERVTAQPATQAATAAEGVVVQPATVRVIRQTPKTSFGSVLKVGAFKVSPPARTRALDTSQPPEEPPEPLDRFTKLEAIDPAPKVPTVGGFQAPEPPELVEMELTPRHPWANNQGHLKFWKPIMFTHEAVSFGGTGYEDSYLELWLNVEEGKQYLVDFAVKISGTNSVQAWHLEGPGIDQEFQMHSGKKHVLAALEAISTGWIQLRLQGDWAGFRFYSAEVTRVE